MLLLTLSLLHLIGAGTAVAALMRTRTPQGAIAWMLALVVVPYLALPAYWVLGPSRFDGYVTARRGGDIRLREALGDLPAKLAPFRVRIPETRGGIRAVETLARMPVVQGNRTQLLVDGHETFESMFRGMEEARDYILVQFYTIRDDELGRRFQEFLMRKAREGVRVHLLFDRIGSRSLPGSYVRRLREAGVEVSAFLSSRAVIRQRFRPRLQINFRNHRKILVVDGRIGWLGGLNLSDAYLGKSPEMGAWRDTHLRVEGPAVLGIQLSFLEDWHWSTERILELNWIPVAAPTPSDGMSDSGEAVLILPSGPADPVETASLMVHHAIHSARRRFWIASPYFVPDEAVVAALKLAAIRGVDVRILVPTRADVPLVHLAKLAAIPRLLEVGVAIYRYTPGFLHQKAFLVDDRAAGVGTVNLDSRSFRLNFEITALLLDRGAIGRVQAMLAADFERSEALTLGELEGRSLWARAGARAAYLLAPIL